MDLLRLFTRMAYWVRRPPSRTHVMISGAVIVLAALLYGIERTVGWPDWMTVEPRAHRIF